MIDKVEHKTHMDLKKCREGYVHIDHTKLQPIPGCGALSICPGAKDMACAECTEKVFMKHGPRIE